LSSTRLSFGEFSSNRLDNDVSSFEFSTITHVQ
jgi:hypothetical protein